MNTNPREEATYVSAEITKVQAESIRLLADAGYELASVTMAVTTGDLTHLKPRQPRP